LLSKCNSHRYGAALPFVFAALTTLSVRKAAGAVVVEVQRQFHTIPGLREAGLYKLSPAVATPQLESTHPVSTLAPMK
jgi:hypothetical protein